MSVRTVITITKTAREALERYEAAEAAIIAINHAGIGRVAHDVTITREAPNYSV